MPCLRRRKSDIAPAKDQLGLEPKAQLREELEKTMAYFRGKEMGK